MGRYGLEVRGASPADAAFLAELLAGAGHAVPVMVLAARLAALRRSAGITLLAQESGPPGGIIVLHWHPVLDSDLPAANVSVLLVAPAERRRGIGRLLVKAGAQAARLAGCGTITLAASGQQTGLDAFCLATGFTQDARRFTRALRKNVAG